ncbi:LAMI_0E12266g1_1 [Lachancea mirantina]|uniref:LAMI_0E12266g1_1 n=1 Tax=Lachancea mirantina TaxID=1230905 RepID=A0A1G4JQ72_9SACH|nr:LAMI_0E12266g1_1 [Lachancea mirantina]
MGWRSGVRDTAYLEVGEQQLTELYWDVILLTESQFLIPGFTAYSKFQAYVVRQVGHDITMYERMIKPTVQQRETSLWRCIGATYSLLFFPDWFQRPFFCKNDATCLQVTIRGDITQIAKPLLMALLEYGATLRLAWLRLYVHREAPGIKPLLRNLNWLGGRIVPNENRAVVLESCSCEETWMFSDEHYVIIEFEC